MWEIDCLGQRVNELGMDGWSHDGEEGDPAILNKAFR